ncbi:hypothetical protein Cni_G27164 [Canna indica]|uniref:Uncharacterized protein n=1 Tax=Canna indica TaxID=4628 RepID=A0AAQ3L179_9LILI|nr:hypothetical protein Cni_G27164 [Canna indica]
MVDVEISPLARLFVARVFAHDVADNLQVLSIDFIDEEFVDACVGISHTRVEGKACCRALATTLRVPQRWRRPDRCLPAAARCRRLGGAWWRSRRRDGPSTLWDGGGEGGEKM